MLSFDPTLFNGIPTPHRALSEQVTPTYSVLSPSGSQFGPQSSATPPSGAYTPSQIRQAYGFDQISGDGSGQTIAIIDAYNDPNITGDLHTFDQQFGLADPNLTVVNQHGGSRLPSNNSSWGLEISLDVEWAHAIAPGANILLVEARSATLSNLLAAVNYAENQPGVAAVSMSWGGSEFSSETSYDNTFLTPSGHSGVTFVASSGDSGPPPIWPSSSPNVLAVGGTTLNSTAFNRGASGETGWSSSGGGTSSVESLPSYQQGDGVGGSYRTTPDVSYDANPNTGFAVYDSYGNGSGGWSQVGGTSAGAPQWAGFVAILDQARLAAGQQAMDNATLETALYTHASDLFDITSGSNGTYNAGPGYDEVTGLGSPNVPALMRDLAGPPPSTHDVAVTNVQASPSPDIVGDPVSVTVTVSDSGTYPETFNVSLADSMGSIGGPAQSVTLAPGGTAKVTFNWTPSSAGSYNLTATASLTDGNQDDNPNNNSLSTSITIAPKVLDVAVQKVTATPALVAQGNTTDVQVVVANTGNQDAASFTVALTDGSNTPPLATWTVGDLQPGATTTLDYKWDTTSASIGSHTLSATATLTGDQNANNNSATTVVSVYAPSASAPGFAGMNFSDTQGWVPPDASIAAGPTQIVETVNSDIAVYGKDGTLLGKTGTLLANPETLDAFFGSVVRSSSDYVVEPQVGYDQQAGRFIVTALDLHGSATYLLVAVSNDSNALDGFSEMHSINVTEYSYYFGTLYGDTPRTGWNANEVAITLNMSSAYGFDHVQLITIDMQSLLDGSPGTLSGTRIDMNLANYYTGSPHMSLTPAIMYGSSSSDPMYFVEEAVGPALNPTGALRVLEGFNLSSNPSFQTTNISVASYTEPPPAAQPGSGGLINTGDSRIASVQWRDGTLVAAQTVGLSSDNLAHVRWYQFSTNGGTPALVQQGTLGVGTGNDTYFPSIAIDANNNLGMTYMESGPNEFMSMYLTGRTSSDPAGQMEPPVLAQAGQAVYSAFDGSPYLAGMFSGIAVDPTDGSFWAVNEFATSAASNNWGTYIANFSMPSSALAPAALSSNSPQAQSSAAGSPNENLPATSSPDPYLDRFLPNARSAQATDRVFAEIDKLLFGSFFE